MKALSILLVLLIPVQSAGCALAAGNCARSLPGPAPGLELNVDITEGTLEAQPSEGQPGLVVFHGTVTVQMPTVRGAEVTLSSSTDIGWVTTLNPTNLQLGNGEPGAFTATVVVPQGSLAAQIGNLMVTGRAVANGVQATDEDRAVITVRPYYRLTLEAARRTAEISPGGTARFSLRIANVGNSLDSFTIQFANEDELRKQGWSLSHTAASLEKVQPGEYRTVTVALSAPAALSPFVNRETTLRVKVMSEGARAENQTTAADYSLVAKETGVAVTGVGVVALVAVVIAVGVVVLLRRRRRMQAEAAEETQPPAPDGPT